ncbi:uncharacterized protein LOC122573040 isoform X2 [Bombus pyrosoma]|uniref:uncharacterized protein LOC122573040 isoform X2 n=1 Tax=Bombus pyrosoma TaxID=396416 RepID=UPI001CB99D88|nr:uncharacterized protein LOC122573040 isoform X2 [Bombus pyrosoma]
MATNSYHFQHYSMLEALRMQIPSDSARSKCQRQRSEQRGTNRIGMERQDGWERSWQRLSVKSCFVSSRYKFDRKVPRGRRCHGKGKFSRCFTSDRCATMRLVQHVLGSSIPMFANMAILFYVLQRFLAATRLRRKIMTEMREFTTIVRRARDNLRYISERVTMGMNEIEGDVGKELRVTGRITTQSANLAAVLRRFTGLEENVIELFVTRVAEISELDIRRRRRIGEASEEEIATSFRTARIERTLTRRLPDEFSMLCPRQTFHCAMRIMLKYYLQKIK